MALRQATAVAALLIVLAQGISMRWQLTSVTYLPSGYLLVYPSPAGDQTTTSSPAIVRLSVRVARQGAGVAADKVKPRPARTSSATPCGARTARASFLKRLNILVSPVGIEPTTL